MYDEALLKAIIENAIDGIIVIDSEGEILSANPSCCALFGYTADEMCCQNVKIIIPSSDGANHNNYINRYEITGESNIIGIGREVTALKKSGKTFPAGLAVSEVPDGGKRIYVGIIHDLTAEKLAVEQLKDHNIKLEKEVAERTESLENIVQELEQAKDEVSQSLLKEQEINQMKTRFVSMASHEFRTPLSSIQLSASLIEHYYDKIDKLKIFGHLAKIKSAVGSLTDILNDFLSVERIESGKVVPSAGEFDIKALCDDIIEGIKLQAKPNQRIKYIHKGSVNVISDNAMLQHCIINLLSNAVKYSGEGALITLTTVRTAQKLNIRVTDNGIGIPEDEQQYLFEAFFRASNVSDVSGTGLGLNIVKRYTELMNGAITVKSIPKKGTAFVLEFPVHE
ncbi:PAS domain-containing sensor histidine kinase [Mucilaginibacter sp. RT5R15]|nr:PAS domain-containing sensor histidine kinase [Mucilaginibacter flavidus]MCO5946604.1 PAS domain-containing sensor histidine kinase [Mucilaginibacter flavidus]